MRTYKWLLIGGGVMMLAAIISLFYSTPYRVSAGISCTASDCFASDSTIAEFVQGNMYATGLSGGVSDDGNVQLLPIGLSSDWFTDTHHLPLQLAELATVIYTDTLYVIGGVSRIGGISTPQTAIYAAPTNMASGSLKSAFTKVADLPYGLSGMAAALYPTSNGAFLYVIGGSPDAGITADTAISYRGLDLNGNFTGSWTTVADALPEGLVYLQAVVRDGYLYVIGGRPGALFSASIYRFTLNSTTGAIGTYTLESNALPDGISSFAAATWTNLDTDASYLYAMGGTRHTGTGDETIPDVNSSQFSGNTVGAFSSAGPLKNSLTAHGGAQQSGQLFTTGGQLGTARTPITGVFSSLIKTDGTLRDWGSGDYWLPSFPIPRPRSYHGSVINSGGNLYVIGGYGTVADGEDYGSDTVYYGSTAGLGSRYAPNGTFTSRVINMGDVRNVSQIQVGSTITTPNNSMSVQYRYANRTSDLLSAAWLDLPSLTTGVGVSSTFNLAFSASLIQYRTLFTTTSPYAQTPALHAFQVRYPPPPTPTPTNTPLGGNTATPTVIGAKPDFTILGINSPNANAVPTTQTITVRITNIGSTYNRRPSSLSTTKPATPLPRLPQGARRTASSGIAGTRAYSGTTSYSIFVDLYINPDPAPSAPFPTGNCMDISNTMNADQQYFVIYALGPGETQDLNFKCYLLPPTLPATKHTFYAQIDTCDDASEVNCSQTYGYVLELIETNNIYGPVQSGSVIATPTPTRTPTRASGPASGFLPLIKKNQ